VTCSHKKTKREGLVFLLRVGRGLSHTVTAGATRKRASEEERRRDYATPAAGDSSTQ
jgi:hypothetical protein